MQIPTLPCLARSGETLSSASLHSESEPVKPLLVFCYLAFFWSNKSFLKLSQAPELPKNSFSWPKMDSVLHKRDDVSISHKMPALIQFHHEARQSHCSLLRQYPAMHKQRFWSHLTYLFSYLFCAVVGIKSMLVFRIIFLNFMVKSFEFILLSIEFSFF